MRIWRNWQTRQIQVLVGATRWRFKSSYPHQTTLLMQGGFIFFDLCKAIFCDTMSLPETTLFRRCVFMNLLALLTAAITALSTLLVSIFGYGADLTDTAKNFQSRVKNLQVYENTIETALPQ